MKNITGQTVDTVIECALHLELEEEDEGLSMASLHQGVPRDEEYHFLQAIQCTIYLNSGHLAVDCNMRIHCPICHSRVHTVDQGEDNMLNRPTSLVDRMEPQRHYRHNDQG